MKSRVHIEIDYFIFMLKKILGVKITEETLKFLQDIGIKFSIEDAQRIKDIEKVTNHDVKAIEYFIKEKFRGKPLEKYNEFVHFGLTSQDINSVSYISQIKFFIEQIFTKEIVKCVEMLEKLSDSTMYVIMMARTHGQPASPTSMGKEIKVFIEKIKFQLKTLDTITYYSKFGGATGNLNAHYVAFPSTDWNKELDNFLLTLGIKRHRYTTQIDNYDMYAIIFDAVRRIQTILVDFCQDIWLYISYDYFKLKKIDGEIGSSTMPHKINPIDFENAEGNLLFSNNNLQFLSNKLPVSRLQRDLTDSTILRNLGVSFGHGLVAMKSIMKGVSKLEINMDKISRELSDHWCVCLEGIQTYLRKEGFENPYELVKKFLEKHPNPDKKEIYGFINGLDVSEDVKYELKKITPISYHGSILD